MPNGVLQSRITYRDRSHNQNNKFPKLKMVDGRHFENSFIIISQAWISDFDELGLQIQILVPRMVT